MKSRNTNLMAIINNAPRNDEPASFLYFINTPKNNAFVKN